MNSLEPEGANTLWRDPPDNIRIEQGEVHIWRAGLSTGGSRLDSLKALLSPDERGRAERFYFEKDRTHFVTARARLRQILSRYAGIPPDQLNFRYGAYGKPALAPATSGPLIRFNLSHSHDLALFAVSLDYEIGIDLEFIRSDFAGIEVAVNFFSPREVEALRALPAHQQTEGFYNCWTRKEAYIKARGEGLSHQLTEFDVTLAPGEPAALLETRANLSEARRWSLAELTPGSGYAGAIAIAGHHYRLRCLQWRDQPQFIAAAI